VPDAEAAGLSAVPRPVLVLSLVGLLPFAAGSLGAWLTGYPDFVLFINLQMAYGAVILSFVAAIHWGLALARQEAGNWRLLGLPVLPAVAGWIALMIPNGIGLLLLCLGFAGVFFLDLQARRAGRLPAWYSGLRKLLTAAVLLALAVSYAALVAKAAYGV
jgi:hypothetical protein